MPQVRLTIFISKVQQLDFFKSHERQKPSNYPKKGHT